MYNFHANRKKSKQQQQNRMKSVSLQKFVNNYYQKRQPILLNNYNKRINDFIRQVQHEPIVIKLDPYQTVDFNEGKSMGKVNRRLSMNAKVGEEKTTIDEDQQLHTGFKFKNTEDWTSLFTPWERIERQKNYEIFKVKYGDPNLAFRSIGSQSEYHPQHEYRERDQNRQINPPMRYTSKPTKQVLAQIRSKYEKKEKQIKQQGNKIHDLKNSIEWEKHLVKSSTQSAIGLNDEMFTTENFSAENVDSFRGNRESEMNDGNGEKKEGREIKKKETKLYFKELIDIEQNLKDDKSKKLLKGILHRCGVFRKKNRRVVTDVDEDEFQKFEGAGHM